MRNNLEILSKILPEYVIFINYDKLKLDEKYKFDIPVLKSNTPLIECNKILMFSNLEELKSKYPITDHFLLIETSDISFLEFDKAENKAKLIESVDLNLNGMYIQPTIIEDTSIIREYIRNNKLDYNLSKYFESLHDRPLKINLTEYDDTLFPATYVSDTLNNYILNDIVNTHINENTKCLLEAFREKNLLSHKKFLQALISKISDCIVPISNIVNFQFKMVEHKYRFTYMEISFNDINDINNINNIEIKNKMRTLATRIKVLREINDIFYRDDFLSFNIDTTVNMNLLSSLPEYQKLLDAFSTKEIK